MKKIGVHDINGACTALGRLPLYVLMDVSAERVLEVRRLVGPEPQIVVRWWEPYLPLDNPEWQARDWFSRHLLDMKVMTQNGADKRICMQGRNEDAGHSAEALWWYEHERMMLLHSEGLNIGLFACSVGEFDPRIWPIFLPIIRAMRPNDFVLLHEYASSPYDVENTWHIARFQHVPELRNAPIAITETGLDTVENQGRGGWRNSLSREQFQNVILRLDQIYSRFPNVVGAAPFTSGRILDQQWRPYDCNDLLGWIVANTESVPFVPPAPAPKPKVVFPLKNINKAWYSADQLFGPYTDHPKRAEDFNLESMGNTDLGEPLVAPFRGVVVNAEDYGKDYGGMIAILSFESLDTTTDLNLFRVRHCDQILVKRGDVVDVGQDIGSIGTGGGSYSAHAHMEMVIVPIPPPKEPWYNARFLFVRPSDWFASHGIPRALVDRLIKYDGK